MFGSQIHPNGSCPMCRLRLSSPTISSPWTASWHTAVPPSLHTYDRPLCTAHPPLLAAHLSLCPTPPHPFHARGPLHPATVARLCAHATAVAVAVITCPASAVAPRHRPRGATILGLRVSVCCNDRHEGDMLCSGSTAMAARPRAYPVAATTCPQT